MKAMWPRVLIALRMYNHTKLHRWEMLLRIAQPDFSPELEGEGGGLGGGGGGLDPGGGGPPYIFSTLMRPCHGLWRTVMSMKHSTTLSPSTTVQRSQQLHNPAPGDHQPPHPNNLHFFPSRNAALNKLSTTTTLSYPTDA